MTASDRPAAAAGSPAAFVGWLALLIAGQAVALALAQAGPVVAYQHYPPYDRWLGADSVPLLGALLLQAALVAAGLVVQRRRRGRLTLPRIGRWRWLFVVAVFVMTGSALSKRPDVYVAEVLLTAAIQATAVGNAALVALSLPEGWVRRLGDRLRRSGDDASGGPASCWRDPVAWIVAGWVLAAALGLVWLSYERHPHVPDEVVYLIHAETFAEGRLKLPAPPAGEAFNLDLMMYDGDTWYSPVPPGWPAVLAIGALLGVPWLVNPVLGAINVLLTWTLMRRLYDLRTARLVTVLLGLSPWHTFMSMNFMTHTFTLTCALASAVGLALLSRSGRVGWAWIAGGAAGAVSLVRPLEGLAVALPLGLWSLGIAGRRFRLAPALGFGLGAALVGSLQLLYNRLMTGSLRSFPIMAYTDAVYGPGTNTMGFGPEKGLGWTGLDPLPGHGPLDVLINADLNLYAINVELLGWACGSWLLVAWWWVAGGRFKTGDRVMAGLVATVVGLHTFYWFAGGPDFGARYWYLTIVPLLALSVRGLERLPSDWNAGPGASRAGARALVAVGALALSATCTFVPWRAVDKYHDYRGMRPDVRELAREHHFGRSLVLVRGERHPDYASAAIYNPLDLRHNDRPVYAWDQGPTARREAIAAFPDRPIWMLDGPSVTGDGFRLVGGPYTAATLPDSDVVPENPEPAGGLQ